MAGRGGNTQEEEGSAHWRNVPRAAISGPLWGLWRNMCRGKQPGYLPSMCTSHCWKLLLGNALSHALGQHLLFRKTCRHSRWKIWKLSGPGTRAGWHWAYYALPSVSFLCSPHRILPLHPPLPLVVSILSNRQPSPMIRQLCDAAKAIFIWWKPQLEYWMWHFYGLADMWCHPLWRGWVAIAVSTPPNSPYIWPWGKTSDTPLCAVLPLFSGYGCSTISEIFNTLLQNWICVSWCCPVCMQI